jgi:hypothetical protein
VANKKQLSLHLPLGGMVKRYSVQNQPDYTSPLCLNVRPESVADLRYRGGTRPGLAKHFTDQVGAGPVRMLAAVEWVSSGTRVSTLVASANGVLKYEQSNGTLSGSVSCSGLSVSSVVISATQLVHAVPLGQVLVIGDWDPDSTISAADRAPKVFDPAAGTLAKITATAGTVPKGCPCIARYRGRIVLAGASSNPQLFYMSRIDNYGDWDSSVDADDEAGAISGGTGDAFTIGEPITALIETGDECMIFGCASSLWILRNDPRSGGAMKNISKAVGIVSPGAWCTTPEGVIIFLSHDGLYMGLGGCADNHPEPLSRGRLPTALLNIGQSGKIVNLAYDQFARGVHVMVTSTSTPYSTGTITVVSGVVTLAGGTFPTWAVNGRMTIAGTEYTVAVRTDGTHLTLTNTGVNAIAGTSYSLSLASAEAEHYFFDWQNRGFWPASYAWGHECTAIHAWKNFPASGSFTTAFASAVAASASATATSDAQAAVGNQSTVLIGCRDGYIRRHRTDQTSDDGTAITSYLVYGPLISSEDMAGIVTNLEVTLATGSGSAVISILAGSAAEEALNSPDRTWSYTYTTAGRNPSAYPRHSGNVFYVKVASSSGSIWTIETINLTIAPMGRRRS